MYKVALLLLRGGEIGLTIKEKLEQAMIRVLGHFDERRDTKRKRI